MAKLHLLIGGLLLLFEVSAASQLLSVLTRDHGAENMIVSPLSIFSALMMTYMGAGGQTAKELETALNYQTNDKLQIAMEYGSFLRGLQQLDGGNNAPTLKVANRIYVSDRHRLAPSYNQMVGNYLDAQAESLDFSNPTAVAARINHWVEEQTANKVKDLVDANKLARTELVIVNAVYFKGRWANEFKPRSTFPQDFYVNSQKRVTVDMMHHDDDYRFAYLPDLQASAIELPYKSSELSMLIVLPIEIDGLAALEQKLRNVDWRQISNSLRREHVNVHLPKFKIEFEMELQDTLYELGIRQLFTGAADLSGLLEKKVPLQVDKVLHKAFLEVNEQGAEAAAATAVLMGVGAGAPPETRFIADHPFVFAIRDRNTVFFFGHVVNP